MNNEYFSCFPFSYVSQTTEYIFKQPENMIKTIFLLKQAVRDRAGDARRMYREIQWVTGAYKGLQWHTGNVHRGWQGIAGCTGVDRENTGGDGEIQGIFIRTGVLRASYSVCHPQRFQTTLIHKNTRGTFATLLIRSTVLDDISFSTDHSYYSSLKMKANWEWIMLRAKRRLQWRAFG